MVENPDGGGGGRPDKFARRALATEESSRAHSFARTHARTHARNANETEIDFPVRGSDKPDSHPQPPIYIYIYIYRDSVCVSAFWTFGIPSTAEIKGMKGKQMKRDENQ